MKKTLRISALLLVLCLCLAFVACDSAPKTQGPATGNDKTGTATAPVSSEEKPEYAIPEGAYYENYEFKILGLGNNNGYSHIDLTAEELMGDPINDAVYERNAKLKEDLGITISSQLDTAAGLLATAKSNIQAELDSYDLYLPTMSDAVSLATSNMLVNLYDVPNLDITKFWWDQAVVRDLTIDGRLYFTTGEIGIMDDDLCYVIAFNKQFLKEFGMEVDPYQLVRDKKWTLNKFSELTRGFNDDLDGNGEMTSEDQWGFITFINSSTVFYQASGERMVSRDGDGFVFSMQTDRASAVVEDVLEFMNGEGFWRTDKMDRTRSTTQAFMDGDVAFRTLVLSTVREFRGMEMDFGVLPYPLFDEDQKEYQTPTSTECYCPGVMIPVTASNLERTGAITELLAYYGYQHLTPAYYETSVKGVISRDEDTWEMLDLIFGNKIYDIGYIYNFGDMQFVINELTKNDNLNYVSKLDSIKDAVAADIQEVLDAFHFNQN